MKKVKIVLLLCVLFAPASSFVFSSCVLGCQNQQLMQVNAAVEGYEKGRMTEYDFETLLGSIYQQYEGCVNLCDPD